MTVCASIASTWRSRVSEILDKISAIVDPSEDTKIPPRTSTTRSTELPMSSTRMKSPSSSSLKSNSSSLLSSSRLSSSDRYSSISLAGVISSMRSSTSMMLFASMLAIVDMKKYFILYFFT
ncbi:hypothetical protein FR483_n726R [Paramecium bursaria Chlorella virus FR483]|uniref:Uncharacterized protein n726R n=1 Tax=Paramecium bursaria Chlorella virus FR483 TaxID=399781 RepID=A7J880_PBCVF|nr:hypothetical protein FR483_n726R [Paramecium bursaria Chlorella virus FR483]ABT16011.1 hypothetical protein FR483_n726R [Paramecium bursaria Chlorella virus FR483]